MSDEKFRCPGRTREGCPDFWTTLGQCAYCGSMNEDEFFSFLDLGWPVIANKETKTFHFNEKQKFCVFHLTDSGAAKLEKYYRDGKLLVQNKG